jgi:hypothetical protein
VKSPSFAARCLRVDPEAERPKRSGRAVDIQARSGPLASRKDQPSETVKRKAPA